MFLYSFDDTSIEEAKFAIMDKEDMDLEEVSSHGVWISVCSTPFQRTKSTRTTLSRCSNSNRMEDDGYHGNDETRSFILSTLAAQRMSCIACVLCQQSLLIFDRYPLIDGTFFLTPVQHIKSAISVDVEGRRQFLSAICMGCLEGWNMSLKCLHCHSPWDGSSLILGTMYSYDIFAAMPCCRERLQCSRCESEVIPSDQRLPFFSEFSRSILCPHCGFLDHHFVKSIYKSYYRQEHLNYHNYSNSRDDS